MLELIEREAVRKVAVSAVNAGIAYAAAHVNGHFGISVNQAELTVAVYGGLEYVRHWAVAKYPGLAPWLG